MRALPCESALGKAQIDVSNREKYEMRPLGAWDKIADPAMMTPGTETFCRACGVDHFAIFGHEFQHCKVCGRWEHITVDGQLGNWPGGDRCFECWFKMPLRKRIAWIRWSMTEHIGLTPDELEGRQLPLREAHCSATTGSRTDA